MAVTYDTVIGLEVHAQLLTASKLFCPSSTAFGDTPNSHLSPVTLGLPGALPVVNRHAVELAVRAALALGCTVHERSVFARKNYFYPDLPKGYQISQYEEPLATDGHLDVRVDGCTRRVGIIRVHMEEDAGKNIHGVGGDSVVDLNRAGVPLIEIVGAPDLRSSAEAVAYLRALREILMFIGVNDGNLEEGSLRCDANVSIRPAGEDRLGTRCELKNLNSFRFVQKAIDVEVARQTAILDAGGEVEQQTRAFHPDTGTTSTLRSKEDAHDYRYFPEPDLPPLVLPDELVSAQRARVGELPEARRERWTRAHGISPSAAVTLTQHPALADFFEATVRAAPDPVRAANWIQSEVLHGARFRGLTAEFSVSPAQLAELLELLESGAISGKQAKDVFAAIEGTDRSPRTVVAELGLQVVSDLGALRPLCEELIAAHPKEAAAVRSGKRGVLGFFVGQVMKRTEKRAEPRLVSELLAELLGVPPE